MHWGYSRGSLGGKDIGDEWCGRAVNHHLGQVPQDLLGSVLGLGELEKLRVLIEETGVHHTRHECGVSENVEKKWCVGLWQENEKSLYVYICRWERI